MLYREEIDGELRHRNAFMKSSSGLVGLQPARNRLNYDDEKMAEK